MKNKEIYQISIEASSLEECNRVNRYGQALRYFTTDSQGGRGYICDKCNYCVWINWWADKK